MYTQTISGGQSRRCVTITDPHAVPRHCYFRLDEAGAAMLRIYAVSQDKRYMVAEGYSDRTCFVLLRIVGENDRGYIAEYADSCANPSDEMTTYPCAVHWYMEQGFCKLEFFDMERILDEKNQSRRLCFSKR